MIKTFFAVLAAILVAAVIITLVANYFIQDAYLTKLKNENRARAAQLEEMKKANEDRAR